MGSRPGERSSFGAARGHVRACQTQMDGCRGAAGDAGRNRHSRPVLPHIDGDPRSRADPRSRRSPPEAFGLANASFFIALLLAQIPVGLAYDRFGPRLTVAALFVPMAAGAMLHGLADTGAQMAVARFVTGIGCAARLHGQRGAGVAWFSRPSWSMTLSWLIALSQLGAGAGRHAAGRGHAADRLALHLRRHGPGGGADRLSVLFWSCVIARREPRAAPDRGRTRGPVGTAAGHADAGHGAPALHVHGRLCRAGDGAGAVVGTLPARCARPRHPRAGPRAPRHGCRADRGHAARRTHGPRPQYEEVGGRGGGVADARLASRRWPSFPSRCPLPSACCWC